MTDPTPRSPQSSRDFDRVARALSIALIVIAFCVMASVIMLTLVLARALFDLN